MMNTIVHRGPDAHGVYIDGKNPVFFGHRRLAILDIVGGEQPMSNEDGKVVVTFNGEIYNCHELRQQLIHAGHTFRSDHSDTEVLVHGYEEWGPELPLKLNGMFAFAIYDQRRNLIFISRDRFGEKPLFYAKLKGGFLFASELSAVVAHPSFEPVLCNRAIQKYFGYGYIPSPLTIYKNAYKLSAGHSLTYDIPTGSLAVSTYWSFRLEPDHRLSDRDEPRLVEELRHLLVEATRRRLLSDVPIGVFLSGGLDSCAVLSAASRLLSPDAIQTFTIGFREPSFDESGPARTVANHFGTRHREEMLDLDIARDLIPSVLSRMDEPLGDPSIIPTYMLSKFVRRHVTVALSGDGGDELFAGYDPVVALAPAALYSKLVPPPLHRLFRWGVNSLPLSYRNMSLDFKLRRMMQGLSFPNMLRAPIWMAPLDPAEVREVFEHPLSVEEIYEEAIAIWKNSTGDELDRMLEFFTKLYLQNDILAKVDRATMMCSLESRAVFLDNDLVDFCRKLPNRFKYHRGCRKYLLKRALYGLVPHEIINRKKKGFGIPISRWLKSVPAQPPLALVPGIHPDPAKHRWDDHRAGRSDQRLFLWNWLALQYMLHPSDGRRQ